MTDPQDWRHYNEYLRRGEALSLWILGMEPLWSSPC